MVKDALLTKYELVAIADARLPEEEKETVRKSVIEAVNKGGGKVINSQVWLEKQKFTFEINKCTDGTYYLVNFEGEGLVTEKIRAILKLNEKVLRFAVIKGE